MDKLIGKSLRDFKAAAETAQPVLVPIDPDIVAWFCSQGNMIREINGLCRFYMDTNLSRELDLNLDAGRSTMADGSLASPAL